MLPPRDCDMRRALWPDAKGHFRWRAVRPCRWYSGQHLPRGCLTPLAARHLALAGALPGGGWWREGSEKCYPRVRWEAAMPIFPDRQKKARLTRRLQGGSHPCVIHRPSSGGRTGTSSALGQGQKASVANLGVVESLLSAGAVCAGCRGGAKNKAPHKAGLWPPIRLWTLPDFCAEVTQLALRAGLV